MAEIAGIVLKRGKLWTFVIYTHVVTRKSVGDTGHESKLTAQSMKVRLPRMANTTQFISSMGIDLMTIALVPIRQSALTKVSLSFPAGLL